MDEPTQKPVKNKQTMMLPPPPRPPRTTSIPDRATVGVAARDAHIDDRAENVSSVPVGEGNLDDHFIPPDTKTIR